MDQLLSASLAQPRFTTILLGAFALVALSLAALGIYGVIAQSVLRRTHEIGIRMALGAVRGDILGLILRQGMVPVLLGVAIGLAGAFALTRLMSAPRNALNRQQLRRISVNLVRFPRAP